MEPIDLTDISKILFKLYSEHFRSKRVVSGAVKETGVVIAKSMGCKFSVMLNWRRRSGEESIQLTYLN